MQYNKMMYVILTRSCVWCEVNDSMTADKQRYVMCVQLYASYTFNGTQSTQLKY